MYTQTSQKGITVVLVLVFAAVFGLSVLALTSFIFSQSQLGASKVIREQAYGIAEAGLEYYHWFLAHNPADLQDGTGQPGPYVHTYDDPEVGEVGSFSLAISGNTFCGEVQSIDVTSTGTANADSRFKRTVLGRHALPSVAEYAFIIGDDVWAGSSRDISGPYHSNGGVRMDGSHNSSVTSAVASWLCDSSFGCDPTSTQNGVFGAGSTPELWDFPTGEISFSDMAANLPNLKTLAQADGVYLAPYGSTEINYSGVQTAVDGYHLIFNSDGTVDIYEVTDTSGFWGYRSGVGWTPDFHVIDDETFVERRSIPTDCPLIFVEDKVWVEGTVNGKVTVVAADLINSYDPDVILKDDLDYSTLTGTDGITVIGENAVLIPPLSPDDLLLRGIFVAQGDRFGRPYYTDDTQTQLTTFGTIVSNNRVGTSWGCGAGGEFCSGYENRENSYDRLQTFNPPPFTPASTTTPRYILWQEL